MLLEQFKTLSVDRKVLLSDVGANPEFRAMINRELTDCATEIIDTPVTGLTKDEVFETMMPLKARHEFLKEIQELLEHIRNELNHDN